MLAGNSNQSIEYARNVQPISMIYVKVRVFANNRCTFSSDLVFFRRTMRLIDLYDEYDSNKHRIA